MNCLFLVFLLVLAVPVWPQAAPAAASAIKGGTVRGTVVGTAGEPLRKAEVTLRSAGRGSAPGPGAPVSGRMVMPAPGQGQTSWSHTTDASGTFVFTGVPAGQYILTAQRNGYVQTDGGTRRAPLMFAVADGGAHSQTVKLTPHSVITGKVTDEDGDPIVRATVQVVREVWNGGRKQMMPMNGTATDDLGQYRIHGLAPGRYHLQVNYQRRGPETLRTGNPGESDSGYAPVFYPGVTELNQAQALQLAPGQEMRGADFQLRKVPVFRIRGKVLDETGSAATQVAVMAVPESGWAGVRGTGVVRGAEGTFEIAGVPPGSYHLVANKATRNQARSYARVPVQLGNRDLDGVVVQLQRAFEVSGVVRAPEGIVATGVRILMEPLDSSMPFGGMNQAPVAADGTWKMASVTPGQYRFGVTGAPEGTYLKTVSVQGQDITDGAQISAASQGIELTLAANAPELSGAVIDRNKQPAGEAIIVLVPEANRRSQPWRFRTARSDESGAWSLRGLTPGQYTVLALPKTTEDGQWFSADFLRTVEGTGSTVKLEEKAREAVQVTLAQ